MSPTTHVLAQFVRRSDLADDERLALVWALHRAALEDDEAADVREQLAVALDRLEEAQEAAHSLRATQILLRETRADADRLLDEVVATLLADSPPETTP